MDTNPTYKTSHNRIYKIKKKSIKENQLSFIINFKTNYIYKMANRSSHKHFKCCEFILFFLVLTNIYK